MDVKVGVLTVSDRASQGEYDDASGPLIVDIIGRRLGWSIAKESIVSDNLQIISERLLDWCDNGVNLILTSGGTGFSPRDVTPEATRQVIIKEAPGIAEVLRQESIKVTQHAMLSRAVAGIRGRSLIINLPGSPKAVKEGLDILIPVLPHALALILDESGAESGHRTV
ncbi:MAG TPA: MogA/MoaB family molybdenum cofactor biosynthesis protein [Patescibacteria group bacterium]|nr:MogA/MoaB family molybdenum cofactor biosynthesis protein [Patescibacteria group bacterium]